MKEPTHLGEKLVQAGLLTQERLQEALRLQKQRGGFFGHILVEEGWITEQQLCQTLAETLHIHWADINNVLINQETLRLVSRSLAITCHILPLFTMNNTLHLAMEHPCETLIKFIERQTGMRVKPLLAPVHQLQDMIRRYYCEEYA